MLFRASWPCSFPTDVTTKHSKFKLFLNLLANFVVFQIPNRRWFPHYFLHSKPPFCLMLRFCESKQTDLIYFLKILLPNLSSCILDDKQVSVSGTLLTQEQDSDFGKVSSHGCTTQISRTSRLTIYYFLKENVLIPSLLCTPCPSFVSLCCTLWVLDKKKTVLQTFSHN